MIVESALAAKLSQGRAGAEKTMQSLKPEKGSGRGVYATCSTSMVQHRPNRNEASRGLAISRGDPQLQVTCDL